MADAYNNGKDILRDFVSDTIEFLILDPAYVFDPDHEFVADVVANELAGAPAETSGFVVMFKFVTNDADSLLVGCYPVANVTQDFTGYTRETAAGKARTITAGVGGGPVYDCNDLTFGGTFPVVIDVTDGAAHVV